MQWIIIALVLAVVASVVSGRVPVAWVVYCFGAFYLFMGGAIFFAFSRNKHHGLLLIGIVYVSSAIAAITMTEWWPLLVGFLIAWVLRAMGMEPEPAPEAPADEEAQSPASSAEGEKKN
jgi:hypothetical protein